MLRASLARILHPQCEGPHTLKCLDLVRLNITASKLFQSLLLQALSLGAGL